MHIKSIWLKVKVELKLLFNSLLISISSFYRPVLTDFRVMKFLSQNPGNLIGHNEGRGFKKFKIILQQNSARSTYAGTEFNLKLKFLGPYYFDGIFRRPKQNLLKFLEGNFRMFREKNLKNFGVKFLENIRTFQWKFS